MYNMLFGKNPASRLLLAMLNLAEPDVGRFRDCYLRRGARGADAPSSDEELYIVIYTRNGGGNRDDYEEVTAALQALPTYVDDYDDDFDCTYASYEFKVPEAFKATAEELASLGASSAVSPEEKFKTLIENLQNKDSNDPAVKRAMEVGKEIFGKIDAALKQGGGKVEV